jgi:hypothetical protein
VFANSLDAEDVGPGEDPVEEDVGVEDEADEGDGVDDEDEDESESESEKDVGDEDEAEEGIGDEVETTGTPDGIAAVPFAANSAARVRSASAINVLSPVRSSRR